MNLLHLSDLHFSAGSQSTIDFQTVRSCLSSLITSLSGKIVLILGGDITFQGSQDGYNQATDFFEKLIAETGIDRKSILMCPGNHDIMAGKAFSGFDAFSYGLRKDNVCTFTKQRSVGVELGGIQFLMLNSSYHEDREYGLIDIDSAAASIESLRTLGKSEFSVAISHHHFVPLHPNDKSTTRNSYQSLKLLEENSFTALIHGHQHFNMFLTLGTTPLSCFGVRSFNFVRKGVANGLNIYTFDKKEMKSEGYGIIQDGSMSYKPRYEVDPAA